MVQEINELDKLTIYELLGKHFYIPHYQRGYRWTPKQVQELLDDIYDFARENKHDNGTFYCLQPVVVTPLQGATNTFEVIDGQQRLTTLYIILNYLFESLNLNGKVIQEYGNNMYTINYATREDCVAFLNNIVENNSNIDYYHIFKSKEAINYWFNNPENPKTFNDKILMLTTILGKKDAKESVQVIWYNINEKIENKETLFNRLNNGKIPLTNAELIKALFLSRKNNHEEIADKELGNKLQIVQQWDLIENELQDDKFWHFISNEQKENFQSKIEILLNLVANKDTSKDPMHTFLYFNNLFKSSETSIQDIWLRIESCYLTIKQWYTDRDNYHKIGYLITTGEKLNNLIHIKENNLNSIFKVKVNELIGKTIKENYKELDYEVNKDKKAIMNTLLLHNVESSRKNAASIEYYPFNFHKKNDWTIEHINAQHESSISKTDKALWLKWIVLHIAIVEQIVLSTHDSNMYRSLLAELQKRNNEFLTFVEFDEVYKMTLNLLQSEEKSATHNIGNLVLLSRGDNSALGNCVFSVKQKEIIELDKNGHFIPIATKRVFLKYYSNIYSINSNIAFTENDKEDYISEIESSLKDYLPYAVK